MEDKGTLADSGWHFWSIIAALVGALLSLQFVVDARPLVRLAAGVSALATALFAGPAVTRWIFTNVTPGDFNERVVMLLIATVGVNLLAGFATFAAKWRKNPEEAFAWLWGLLGTFWRRP